MLYARFTVFATLRLCSFRYARNPSLPTQQPLCHRNLRLLTFVSSTMEDSFLRPNVLVRSMEQISTDSGDSDLPFSEAIRHGDTIYVSGQGPLDPETGTVVGDTVQEQTAKTLENIGRILEAGGSSLDHIVKATVYIQDMDHYDAVNQTYEKYVSKPYPARTAVEVADLPVPIDVEIEVIAATD